MRHSRCGLFALLDNGEEAALGKAETRPHILSMSPIDKLGEVVVADVHITESDTPRGDAGPNAIAPTHIHDWFLASLISWANTFELEQGITLSVGGATVSGQLISGRRYFEELAETVS